MNFKRHFFLLSLIFQIKLIYTGTTPECKEDYDYKAGFSNWRSSSLNNSLFEFSPVIFSVQQLRSTKTPFQVDLTMFDQHFNLTLHRMDASIFGLGVKYQGQSVSNRTLRRAERNIFVDPHKMAVLKLVERRGNYKMEGFVNGVGIRHEPCRHLAVRSVPPKTPVRSRYNENKQIGQNSKPKSRVRIERKKKAIVEIKFILDETLGILVGNTADFILLYAAIMVKAANLIFQSLNHPDVQLRLIEVQVLTEEEDLQIIHQNQGYIDPILRTFRETEYFFQGPSAVVPLLTGLETLDLDEEGNTIIGVYGAAPANFLTPGACQGDLKASVNRDRGGVWSAVQTLVKNIGFALNAPDDFGTECDDDYVMGFYGHSSKNSFKFSRCSQMAINEFLETEEANCLFDKPEINIGKNVKFPGQIINLKEQCEVFLEGFACIQDDETMEEIVQNCLGYTCNIKTGTECLDISNSPADEPTRPVVYDSILDGTPCVRSGKNDPGMCKKGICVKAKSY